MKNDPIKSFLDSITTKTDFEFEVGENVYIYTNEGYEPATITGRMFHGDVKYYTVDIFGLPQKEAYLRKIFKPSNN